MTFDASAARMWVALGKAGSVHLAAALGRIAELEAAHRKIATDHGECDGPPCRCCVHCDIARRALGGES